MAGHALAYATTYRFLAMEWKCMLYCNC